MCQCASKIMRVQLLNLSVYVKENARPLTCMWMWIRLNFSHDPLISVHHDIWPPVHACVYSIWCTRNKDNNALRRVKGNKGKDGRWGPELSAI